MKPVKGGHPLINSTNAITTKERLDMVFDYEILYKAWKQVSKGKHDVVNQAEYECYLEDNLYSLKQRMNEKTFRPSPFRQKKIYIPKFRIAQVPGLEDKIVQHAICDNYAYDALTRPLTKDTCACLKMRGEGQARKNLLEQYGKFYRKYGVPPYILKCDISKYFASIEHGRLKGLIERYVKDEDARYYLFLFLDMTEVGLPLGLQQSQLLANLNLSELDHIIKEEYRFKYYGRYMDDFYMFSNSKEELEIAFMQIEMYLNEIGLNMNKKSGITYNSFEFLGFKFHVTETGKVIKRLVNNKKKTQKNRLRVLVKELAENEKTIEQIRNSYEGWRMHALKGNTYRMVENMDNRFEKLLAEEGYRIHIDKKGRVKIWQEKYRR